MHGKYKRLFAAAVSAGLVSLAVIPAAPAMAVAKPAAPVAPLPTGPAVRHHLRALYAAYRAIPVSDIAPVAAGAVVTARTSDGRDWAMIHFRAVRRAPGKFLVAFQDGAGTGIFTRTPGHPWAVAGLAGEPMGCAVKLPAPVRRAWRLPGCQVAHQPPRQPAGQQEPAGTPQDLVNIARAQVGVGDDPPSTSFSDDCNPYTTLVGEAGLGTCSATESHGSWFHNVRTHNEEWCADFTKWVWEKAGVTSDLGTLTPSAASFYSWGVQHGEHISFGGTPKAGDAVLFYPPSTSAPNGTYADHVGIVASVNSNGSVNLVNGDFLGSTNITVQYNTNISGPSWYASGEEWAFVSPLLKASPPPSSLPGGPAVFDPIDSAVEVYGTGSNGHLQEDWWSKAKSWQSGQLGVTSPSPVTGKPSAVYDPIAKHLEIFATGQDGQLQEYWWSKTGGWNAGQLMATPSNITGSPAAVYDPVNNAIEIYATGQDGHLQEDWWKNSTWHSGELMATPANITASPSAVYDPIESAVEIYATGTNGQLQENWWNKAASWHAGQLAATPSNDTGSPSAVYHPGVKAIEIYTTGQDGQLQENWWNKASSWHTGELMATPANITASPSAVYDPIESAVEIYATGTNGQLQENWWNKAGNWHAGQLLATPANTTGSPGAIDNPAESHIEIYDPGTNGQWQEAYWSKAHSWQAGQLLATPSPITSNN